MLGCGCRICKSGNAETVNNLVLVDGFTLSEVHQWVTEELGLEFTLRGLLKHFDAFEIKVKNPVKSKAVAKVESEELPNVAFSPKEELAALDISDLSPDADNPYYLIGKLQSLHLDIHIKQTLLLRQYLNLCVAGEIKAVPNDLYRNSKITFEMLVEITAMNQIVSLKTAIDTVTRAGYTITPKANSIVDS